MGIGAEGWVIISLIAFFLVVLYFKVPAMVAQSLDDRSAEIKNELDEARKLKEDAQALLAEYQRKRNEADQEAEEIIAQAKKEAEAYGEETRAALKETLERRTRLAEEKIARAEEQAIGEVKSTAVNVAVAAAESLIRRNLSGSGGDKLVDAGIEELKSKLN